MSTPHLRISDPFGPDDVHHIRGCVPNALVPHQPRRAALILAMSILSISIIAAKARLASAPPADSASINTRGVICQEMPQRSLHQPHALSSPPLVTIALQ